MRDAVVAEDRVAFLCHDEVSPSRVRAPILASWQRSRDASVDADRVDPPYAEPEVDTPLSRAAAPALRELRAAVDAEPMSILLTDGGGLVLSRVTDDRRLDHRLDKAMLAPGFRYAESCVGTNGIGTALEMGGPAHVLGHEHYAENLEDLACAAVPVTHPVTGRTVGVVNLTTWRHSAGSLLLTLARTTACRVHDALLDQAAPASRALFEQYVRADRRHPGAVVAVNDQVAMVNDTAGASLDPADRDALLGHARAVLAAGRDTDVPLVLTDGDPAVLRARVVSTSGPAPAGVVAVLTRQHVPVDVPEQASCEPEHDGRRLSALERLERDAIRRALADSAGDKTAAAKALGMSRATIYRRIRTYRII